MCNFVGLKNFKIKVFLVEYLVFYQFFLGLLDIMSRKMKKVMSPPHLLIIHMYVESKAIQLAIVIIPLRRKKSKHYDFCILTFMNIEAEECNVHVCNDKENNI